MGWDGSGTFIMTVLVISAVLATLIYGYMEYQVRMLRTSSTRQAGGLLFTSKFLTVGTRNATQEVVVNAPTGWQGVGVSAAELVRTPAATLAVVLPAVGLRCEVKVDVGTKAQDSGDRCTITLTASDPAKLEALGLPAAPAAVAVIPGVPLPVARSFQGFAVQMGLWVERVENRIQLERAAEQKKKDEEAAALAAAEAKAQRAADKTSPPKEDWTTPVSDEERKLRVDKQIAAWRTAAGFKGSSSEFSAGPGGKVQWFIDLEPSGKVILHSAGRTFHGSLKGAKVTSLSGELEVGVRDALWTEDEPTLSNFNVMAGAKPETRLAWKERLEILIRSLR